MSRESGFLKITSVETALSAFLQVVEPVSRSEQVRLEDADGRVLAENIFAPIDVPSYDRCAMDGYAVVAADTFGSGREAGVRLRLVTSDRISRGECRQVHTGSALPAGADAVIQVEHTELAVDSVELLSQVAPGQNIGFVGEDVNKGSLVFPRGRQLKPSDVGLLLSLGLEEALVFERPVVTITPTGDEIVARGGRLEPGSVYESNGVMTLLYTRRFGGVGKVRDIVPDNLPLLSEALRESAASSDLIVTTGGSSVGKRDLIADAVDSAGKVIVHGVAIKPGKPVALGYVEASGRRVPIICLPGYPAACAVDAMAFLDPALKKLGNLPPTQYRTRKATLARKIFSEPGFRTYTRVSVENGEATPLRTKGAGILSSLSRADGYVITPEDVEGYEAGSTVEVVFLEP